MHILDFIMYFVTAGILWFLIDKLSDGEYTNELGGLVGMAALIIYTVFYVFTFVIYPDWNWIDFNINFDSIGSWFKL